MQNDSNQQTTEMSPFTASTSIKYDNTTTSPSSSSTTLISNESKIRLKHKIDISDDEISVGCPSPVNATPEINKDEYFKPLKMLKMEHQLIQDQRLLSPAEASLPDSKIGVRSFSIMEILNHKPKTVSTSPIVGSSSKIVRPWDRSDNEPNCNNKLSNDVAQWSSLAQQMAFLRRADFAAVTTTFGSSYTSETGSDRSSSVTSDCCSPDNNNSIHFQQNHKPRTINRSKGSAESTPLDALFQMTSKTFDSNSAEVNSDGQNMHLYNSRQQQKKKRKSRTAFTNHQIFELEKRFLYQKYLSPADRDEIASTLGLTNAQVITWFQNRRAKLKRDVEELKKDVESAKILTAHKTFFENVQDLNPLKKKPILSVNDK